MYISGCLFIKSGDQPSSVVKRRAVGCPAILPGAKSRQECSPHFKGTFISGPGRRDATTCVSRHAQDYEHPRRASFGLNLFREFVCSGEAVRCILHQCLGGLSGRLFRRVEYRESHQDILSRIELPKNVPHSSSSQKLYLLSVDSRLHTLSSGLGASHLDTESILSRWCKPESGSLNPSAIGGLDGWRPTFFRLTSICLRHLIPLDCGTSAKLAHATKPLYSLGGQSSVVRRA